MKAGDFVALNEWPERVKDTRVSHYEAFVVDTDGVKCSVVFRCGFILDDVSVNDVHEIPDCGERFDYWMRQADTRVREQRKQFYYYLKAKGEDTGKQSDDVAFAAYRREMDFV